MEHRLGVAADERQRGAQLVTDRRDEALAKLLEGPRGRDIPEDRGRRSRRARLRDRPLCGRHERGEAAGHADGPPIGTADRHLEIADRAARREDPPEGTVLGSVAPGHVAAQ